MGGLIPLPTKGERWAVWGEEGSSCSPVRARRGAYLSCDLYSVYCASFLQRDNVGRPMRRTSTRRSDGAAVLQHAR